MFGRKKPEDQNRAAEPAGAANGQTRSTPSFGSAGSLSLRKPSPAKPMPNRGPDIPGAIPGAAPRDYQARRADPLQGTALAQDHKTLLVARDVSISGKVGPCERLLVEGQLEAAVGDCRELDVARNASFKGSIRVEDADIAGLFDGEMVVRRRLRVRATGRLRGRISYGHIEIEPGGQIDGEVARLQPVVPQAPTAEAAADSAGDDADTTRA
jgi:cytoskeletal protein CcmA (bactofilin family)